jgi:hypothetical protein
MKRLIILLLLTSGIKAQMVIITTPGDSAMNCGNYALAISLFKDMVKQERKTANDSVVADIDMYNISCAYARMNNKDSAFAWLNRYCDLDGLKDPDYYNLIDDPRWIQVRERASRQYFKEHPGYNKEKVFALWRIDIQDQAFYAAIKILTNVPGYDKEAVKQLWAKKDSLNKVNLAKIREMGFPPKEEVGVGNLTSMIMVIQHSTLDVQKEFFPAVKKMADKGDIRKEIFALLTDRILVSEGKKQIYGSQVKTDSTGKQVFFPMEDELNVNKRRAEMGLEPIEAYAKRFGFEYHYDPK